MVLTFDTELTPGQVGDFCDRMNHAVLLVYVEEMDAVATGFFIRDKYILTASSVFMGGQIPLLSASVYPWTEGISNHIRDGQPERASIIHMNLGKGLALLKVDALEDREYAMLETEPIRMGYEVHCICHPCRLEFSYLRGYVSRSSCTGYDESLDPDTSLIAINNMACEGLRHGAFGAPVFNARGRVVGMLLGNNESVTWALSFEEISTIISPFIF